MKLVPYYYNSASIILLWKLTSYCYELGVVTYTRKPATILLQNQDNRFNEATRDGRQFDPESRSWHLTAKNPIFFFGWMIDRSLLIRADALRVGATRLKRGGKRITNQRTK